MRVGSFAVARPNYYDRNAAPVIGAYNGDVAPHAITTRWTTTVASGKKVQVESHLLSTFRLTAATVVSTVAATIGYTSGSTTAYVAFTLFVNNTLYYREVAQGGQSITLYSGDTLFMTTEDLSTGGTMRYNGYFKGTTYDA